MTTTLNTTPKADGFRMPGEFEPHQQTWMLWPERPDNWRMGAKPAQRAWVSVASAIARFEPVTVGVNHISSRTPAICSPSTSGSSELSSDDAWVRDCGPSFVVNDAGSVRAVDWVFNAWGGVYDGLYFPWDKDDMVARKIAEIEELGPLPGADRARGRLHPRRRPGNRDHDRGVPALAGAQPSCADRDRGRSGRIPERRKVIWLARGIDPEETNGHVDDVACFVSARRRARRVTEDKADWRFEILQENLSASSAPPTPEAVPFEVVKMPVPATGVHRRGGLGGGLGRGIDTAPPRRQMPATYLNSYIVNGGIVMPVFDDPNDELRAKLEGSSPIARSSRCPAREIVLGAATCTASPSNSRAARPGPSGVRPSNEPVVGPLPSIRTPSFRRQRGGYSTPPERSWPIRATPGSRWQRSRRVGCEPGSRLLLLRRQVRSLGGARGQPVPGP